VPGADRPADRRGMSGCPHSTNSQTHHQPRTFAGYQAKHWPWGRRDHVFAVVGVSLISRIARISRARGTARIAPGAFHGAAALASGVFGTLGSRLGLPPPSTQTKVSFLRSVMMIPRHQCVIVTFNGHEKANLHEDPPGPCFCSD
jgi:hypothetical protein